MNESLVLARSSKRLNGRDWVFSAPIDIILSASKTFIIHVEAQTWVLER